MKSATSAKPAPKLMSADDALARILAGVPTLPAVETPLLDALGLVLAEDVAADRDVPSFRNSAMDGYAVRGDDVASAPVELRVVGEVAAGEFPDRDVGPGEAMRIMTGAPMPDGADTVVRVEDTDNANDVVTIAAATPTGMAVRNAGEDLKAGEVILTKGTLLRAAEIGLLASDGRARIRVRKRPRVAVFSTGDENTATLGRFRTRMRARPSDARRPISAARSSVPFVRMTSPAFKSSPALRTAIPVGVAAAIVTTSFALSVSSTRTTVSAPSGIGAPVMMRIASPGPTARSGNAPAATSPTTRSSTGAEATSSPRTA